MLDHALAYWYHYSQINEEITLQFYIQNTDSALLDFHHPQQQVLHHTRIHAMEQHWAGTFTQMSPPPRSDSQAYPSSHSDLGPSTQKCPSTQKWPSPAFVSQGDPSSHSDLGPSSSNASVTISELEELSGKPKEPGTRIAVSIAFKFSRAIVAPSTSRGLLTLYSVRDVVAFEGPVISPNPPIHVRYAWQQTSGVRCPTLYRNRKAKASSMLYVASVI